MEPKLKIDFHGKVVPALKEQFAYKNDLQVPRLEKIVLSQGIGDRKSVV